MGSTNKSLHKEWNMLIQQNNFPFSFFLPFLMSYIFIQALIHELEENSNSHSVWSLLDQTLFFSFFDHL